MFAKGYVNFKNMIKRLHSLYIQKNIQTRRLYKIINKFKKQLHLHVNIPKDTN